MAHGYTVPITDGAMTCSPPDAQALLVSPLHLKVLNLSKEIDFSNLKKVNSEPKERKAERTSLDHTCRAGEKGKGGRGAGREGA